jgi:hypothetical protein
MTYALIQNGAVATYPYSFAMLRRDNPQVSFPQDMSDDRLEEFGVFAIAPTAKPTVDLTKNIVEAKPVLANGMWTQAWTVVDASAEEIAARQRAATDDAARMSIKADTFVGNFIAMTPAEVASHIDTNVTNLATAKTVITKLALMVLLLARREFRD